MTGLTGLPAFPVRVTLADGSDETLQSSEILARPAVAKAFFAGMLGDGVARPGLRAEAEIECGFAAGLAGRGFEDIRKLVLDLAARLASPGRVAVWEWPLITTVMHWWLVPVAEDDSA